MAKSAQQRFDEYLSECRETTNAVNEMVSASVENYRSYAYATGVLATLLQEAVADLPRAQRAAVRERLYRMAQNQRNEHLAKELAQREAA